MSGILTGTSPSASQPTTPFTPAELTDVRRFCGYEAYGAGASGFQSWRFFTAYGTLEFKMQNLQPQEFAVVRTYLGTLYALEAALTNTSNDLDTARAAIFTRNPQELPERQSLYDGWRRRLCGFLGVPPGPSLDTQTSTSIVI